MAARPIYRQMIAKLNQAGGIPWVLDEVCNGKSLTQIAGELKVSRTFLSKEVNRDTTRAAYIKAREEAAHALADEAKEIADTATPVNAVTAKLQIDARRWLAKVMNPKDFSENTGTTVQVNVGQLMLDDLRKRTVQTVEITKQIEGSESNDDSIDG